MTQEIYPRAPVQFVTFEAQYPLTPALARTEGKEAVYERMADAFPLLESLNTVQVQFALGGPEGMPAPVPVPGIVGQQMRMTNRQRTTSVTIGSTNVLVECADHESFAGLQAVVRQVLQAIAGVAALQGVERLSLRYVDEIRHPSATSPRDWSNLLRCGLTGPLDLLDAPVLRTEGAIEYRISSDHSVRVVFGAEPTGFAVDPRGPLRVRPHDEGPFFRMSTESTWSAPSDDVPPFAVDDVMRICEALHPPISTVFETAITPQLRDHFRRTDGD